MTIIAEYLEIANRIATCTEIPLVDEAYFPTLEMNPDRAAEFGVIVLADGSVGLTYLYLDPSLRDEDRSYLNHLEGKNPLALAQHFAGKSGWQTAVALGALNAIGQSFLRRVDYPFDFSGDSLAAMDLGVGDKLGMVGYFPPLVERVRELDIPLTVIEKKDKFVQSDGHFEVTLETRRLAQCNKVLCTSTTVLNNSLDDILGHCQHAEQITVIGPTAGFLPDPLFKRGVHTLGGTTVQDATTFLQRCRNDERWGNTSKKYYIHREDYPGFEYLLAQLR